MSVNGASTSKAPVQEPQHHPRTDHGLVKVQPARLDDLQPRYASTIEHDQDNPEAHGWYARLSELHRPGHAFVPNLTTSSPSFSP